MRVREIRREDRVEWVRMLVALHDGPLTGHASDADAFYGGGATGQLRPAVVFVAERAGAGLCGFIELSVRNYAEGCTGAAPYVESWYVDPDRRGSGVGRRLMAAAEAWARGAGYRELASDTDIQNSGIERAHRALGFEVVERAVCFRKRL